MNKKSIFAFVLVLALIAGCMTTAAYADEKGSTADNPAQMSYADIDPSVYDGAWVDTGLGFDVYLPVDWVIVKITEEQAAAGLAFQAGEEGGGANMTVTLTKAPEGYTYEQLGKELAASATTAMYVDLNGIPAVVFENEQTKISGYSFLTGDNGLITGVVSAPSDDQYDAYVPYIQNMIMSVSPSMTELNWENFKDDAKKVDPDGAFVKFDEIGVQMWISSILNAEELTDEDKKDGCVAYYRDAAGEVGVTVYYYDDITLENYFAEIAEYDNCTEPETCLINGYNAFSYDNTEYDTMSIVLDAGDDCVEFTFWPESDENFSALAVYMAASIQEP